MQNCRFDQLAYPLNPADESVNSVILSSYSQIPQYQTPHTHLPQPYPSDWVTAINHQGQETRSFSINQHIGLDEPPVINAREFNNSIKVQYQFGHNDKFAVQSTKESTCSDFLGWQNISDHYQSHTVNVVQQNKHNQAETVIDRDNSKNLDQSEIVRFSVFNIPKKNCSKIRDCSYVDSVQLNSVYTDHNSSKQAREISQSGIDKQLKEKETSGESSETQKEKTNNTDETVNIIDNYYLSEVPELLDHGKDVEINKGQKAEIADTLFVNKGKKHLETQAVKTDNDNNLKELKSQENVTKNSLKKTKALVKPKSKGEAGTVRKSYKKSEALPKKTTSIGKKLSDEITLLQLTYQCGECADTYNEVEDLFNHINVKHSENTAENEETSVSDCKTDKELDEKNSKLDYELDETNKNHGCLKTTIQTEVNEVNTIKKTREDFEANVVNEGKSKTAEVELQIMSDESEDIDLIMEVESENVESKSQCLLCPLCAYCSNSQEEEELHKKTHEEQTSGFSKGHSEEREYVKQCQEMIEVQKKNILAENVPKDNLSCSSTNASKVLERVVPNRHPNNSGTKAKKIADKSISVADYTEILEEKKKIGLRNREKTQAKNSLMNPSKGKQKRVRDTENFGKEDRMLMEMFGIIPSKVCLSRVEESDNLESKNRNNTNEEVNSKTEIEMEERKEFKEENIVENKKVNRNHWTKVLSMSNCENEENEVSDKAYNSDDSDIEIVEPPVTLIVLDDDISNEIENIESSSKTSLNSLEKGEVSPKRSKKVNNKNLERVSPKKSNKGSHKISDKKAKECIIAKDVSEDIEKETHGIDNPVQQQKNKSDAELLEKYGIKNLRINLSNTPSKLKQTKVGPKQKSYKGHLRGSKSHSEAALKNIEEMSPTEIEKLLYECGMGITVPVQSKISKNGTDNLDRSSLTPSPVPSTSKGHGHLKRKKTARKSTKDSALFKKYKLKDSKVIIENLSRIDVSMIRNPNSPFGKSDWLKHKFDSDSDSDFDFDIPTPPLLEEFEESAVLPRNDRPKQVGSFSQRLISPGRSGRKSPLKEKELQVKEKFGISDSVVVIESPKKMVASRASKSSEKKVISDEELRKKFGIPNTMVVINTPEKTQETCLNASNVKVTPESSHSQISFAEFQSAIDSARKNILSRMKESSKSNLTGKRKSSAMKQEQCKQHKTKVIRKPEMEQVENKNCIGSKLKKSNNDVKITKRKNSTHFKANGKSGKCAVPNNLKTLTVDINKLKLNEACKTYKARAVSRALEIRRVKDKVAKELDDSISKTPTKSKKRLRGKVSEDLSENSSKTKCLNIKVNETGSKKMKFERKVHVVKTARYRRSVLGKKDVEETCRIPDIKQLAKGLPVVKVALPCLTNEQIIQLSHNIEKSTVSVESSVEMTSEDVASQIINELIDKILSTGLSSVEYKLSDSVEDVFKDDSSARSSRSSEKYVTVASEETDFIYGEENSSLMNTDSAFSEIRKSGKNDGDTKDKFDIVDSSQEVQESESDLSLISETIENKENENIVMAENDNECDKDNGMKYKLEKKPCEVDVIPLGKTRFYDEENDMSEKLQDEVDGDNLDSNGDARNDDVGTFDGNNAESKNENAMDCDEINTTVQKTYSKSVHSKDSARDVNDEKENINDDENCANFTHTAEMTKTVNRSDPENVDSSARDNPVMKVQILSSIIDSESGSLIGDVYSIDETTGNSRDGGRQAKGDKNDTNFPISQMGNAPRMGQSAPMDIIEAITES